MIRGTTAQFKFKLPYNVSEIGLIKITFWQENYNGPDATRPLPIVKTLKQCNYCDSPNEVTVKLNKEETLRFSDERKAYVQIQGKTIDRVAFAGKKSEIMVYPIYDDSILDDEIVPTPTPLPDDVVILDGSTIA